MPLGGVTSNEAWDGLSNAFAEPIHSISIVAMEASRRIEEICILASHGGTLKWCSSLALVTLEFKAMEQSRISRGRSRPFPPFSEICVNLDGIAALRLCAASLHDMDGRQGQ
jgi:hypothetical protein